MYVCYVEILFVFFFFLSLCGFMKRYINIFNGKFYVGIRNNKLILIIIFV